MNLTTFTPTDFHAFLHPASAYQTPDDVLRDPTLSDAEKRVILSSWASDANVVESQPWLRQIPAKGRHGDPLARPGPPSRAGRLHGLAGPAP